MFNTIVIDNQHADLGMPASGRVWAASLRALPTTIGAYSGSAVQKCVLVRGIDVSDDRFGIDDVATGAFPGTSAWSPPI